MTLPLVAADSQPLLPVTQVKRSSSQGDFGQQIQKKIKVQSFPEQKSTGSCTFSCFGHRLFVAMTACTLQMVAKEREKLRAAEKRQEQKERQVRRETAGMKKLSSFFSPKG